MIGRFCFGFYAWRCCVIGTTLLRPGFMSVFQLAFPTTSRFWASEGKQYGTLPVQLADCFFLRCGMFAFVTVLRDQCISRPLSRVHIPRDRTAFCLLRVVGIFQVRVMPLQVEEQMPQSRCGVLYDWPMAADSITSHILMRRAV